MRSLSNLQNSAVRGPQHKTIHCPYENPIYSLRLRPAKPESEEFSAHVFPALKTPGYYLSPLRGFEVACGLAMNPDIRRRDLADPTASATRLL